MVLTPYAVVALMLAFIGFGGFFALAESALFSLGKWRTRQWAERSSGAGQRVLDLLAKPQDLLATIALGNTFANAGLIATGLVLVFREQWPMVPTVAGLLALCLVGSEVVPKTVAVRNPEAWSLRLARAMQTMVGLTRPIRRLAQLLNGAILRAVIPDSAKPQQGLTDEEYEELLELAYQQGTLAQSEKEIILQIISLDRRSAREVMRSRSRMVTVSDDATIEEMVAAARRHKMRRLPLYDEETDSIVGVLNTQTLLLNPDLDLAEAVEFPSFVPETMNLLQLFKSLQRQRRELAIVLDEFGGTAGVVTMEDIVEELVGDFRDEDEVKGFVMERRGEGRWKVSGTMRVDDFRREYPQLPDVPGVETMGGLMTALLGVIPDSGQHVTVAGLRLTAQVADERRVHELLVETVSGKGGTL